jgi:hypothetical protein
VSSDVAVLLRSPATVVIQESPTENPYIVRPYLGYDSNNLLKWQYNLNNLRRELQWGKTGGI